MINNRIQYDFVNIPATMIIDGGILPKRANKEILRGEDPCFIREAVLERQMVQNGYVDGVYQMDHYIKGDHIWYPVGNIYNMVNIAIDDYGTTRALTDVQPLTSYSIDVQSTKDLRENASPTYIDNRLALVKADLKSNQFDFARNQPLRKQSIQNVLDDINLLSTFQVEANIDRRSQFSTNLEYDKVITGTYDRWSEPGQFQLLVWDKFRTSTIKQEMKSTSGSFKLVLGSQRMKYIESGTMWLAFNVNLYRNNYEDSGSITEKEFHTVYYPKQAMKLTDGFRVPVADVKDCITDIKSKFNMQFQPDADGGIYEASISIWCKWMILTINNRTRWQ